MAPYLDSAAEHAELLRLTGNAYYRQGRYDAAIEAYTKSIALCPDVAKYWTNRAICHLKQKEWANVEDDSRRAIKLDSGSVKGHYTLGIALLGREEYGEGIKELEKALDLERGERPSSKMAKEIWQKFADAKYRDWERSSGTRSQMLKKLKEACEEALTGHQLLHDAQTEDDPKKVANDRAEQLELLEEVFSKAAVSDTPTEIPDYLCCKITLDIFRDPVITPSGVTYERADLIEHMQKVGKNDPITAKPLEQDQLVPNLAIKEAVEAYLKEHGWAYKN